MNTEELISYCVKRAHEQLDKAGPQCQNTDAAKRARDWLQRAIQVRATADVANEVTDDNGTAPLPFVEDIEAGIKDAGPRNSS